MSVVIFEYFGSVKRQISHLKNDPANITILKSCSKNSFYNLMYIKVSRKLLQYFQKNYIYKK